MKLPDLKEPDYWALNKLFSLAIDFMQLLQMDIFWLNLWDKVLLQWLKWFFEKNRSSR